MYPHRSLYGVCFCYQRRIGPTPRPQPTKYRRRVCWNNWGACESLLLGAIANPADAVLRRRRPACARLGFCVRGGWRDGAYLVLDTPYNARDAVGRRESLFPPPCDPHRERREKLPVSLPRSLQVRRGEDGEVASYWEREGRGISVGARACLQAPRAPLPRPDRGEEAGPGLACRHEEAGPAPPPPTHPLRAPRRCPTRSPAAPSGLTLRFRPVPGAPLSRRRRRRLHGAALRGPAQPPPPAASLPPERRGREVCAPPPRSQGSARFDLDPPSARPPELRGRGSELRGLAGA